MFQPQITQVQNSVRVRLSAAILKASRKQQTKKEQSARVAGTQSKILKSKVHAERHRISLLFHVKFQDDSEL